MAYSHSQGQKPSTRKGEDLSLQNIGEEADSSGSRATLRGGAAAQQEQQQEQEQEQEQQDDDEEDDDDRTRRIARGQMHTDGDDVVTHSGDQDSQWLLSAAQDATGWPPGSGAAAGRTQAGVRDVATLSIADAEQVLLAAVAAESASRGVGNAAGDGVEVHRIQKGKAPPPQHAFYSACYVVR